VLNDPIAQRLFSNQRWLRILPRRHWSRLSHHVEFVISTASNLAAVASVVRAANSSHHLRAVIVRADVDPQALPQVLEHANIRTLRNMLIHSDQVVPQRVLQAWRVGAQDDLVAQAFIAGDELLVVSCSLEKFRVALADIAALRKLSTAAMQDIEVDGDGSYVYWPQADVHLELASIRYLCDEEWRLRQDRAAFLADEAFGRTIAYLRKERAIRQADVRDLSARQVRRIEAGARPSLRALRALASAFSLSVDDFLALVAKSMQEPERDGVS
jgi:hypothetical protein